MGECGGSTLASHKASIKTSVSVLDSLDPYISLEIHEDFHICFALP